MPPETPQPDGDAETPVCLHCLAPVSPFAHVCGECGHSVGQFTPYLPFEGIRFSAECIGTIWDRLWYGRGRSAAYRLFCAGLIAFAVPWLFLASPLVLWQWLKKRRPVAPE